MDEKRERKGRDMSSSKKSRVLGLIVGFVIGMLTLSCASPRAAMDLASASSGTGSGMGVGARGELVVAPVRGLELGARGSVRAVEVGQQITTPSQGRGGGTVTVDESREFGQVSALGVVRLIGPITGSDEGKIYVEAFGGPSYERGSVSVLGTSRGYDDIVPVFGGGMGVELGRGAIIGVEWQRADDVDTFGLVFGTRF